MYERMDHQAIVRENKLIVIGGTNEQNEVLGHIWVFDGSTWDWQNTDREDLFKYRNKVIEWDYNSTEYILSIGGRDVDHTLTNDIYYYDYQDDWSGMQFNTRTVYKSFTSNWAYNTIEPLEYFSVINDSGLIYVIGGLTASGSISNKV